MISKFHKFVAWNFAYNFFSSINSVLGTDSMLFMLHKTSEETRTMNMTYNYVGKDIIGQFGGLLLSYYRRKRVDKNPISSARKSVLFQQLATGTDLCLRFVGTSWFLPLAGCSNVLKNVSWIGFGAFNNQRLYNFAKNQNIGELYTIFSISNTLSSSIGMLVGTSILPFLTFHHHRWILFGTLSCFQYFCFHQMTKIHV